MSYGIGIGMDVHAVDADRPLWVAGLHWPGEPGLAGHSDADPVAHACADAILNACGLGDLGAVFGTDRPEWADAAGLAILAEAGRLAREAGFEVVSVGVQLIGNRPRIGARRQEAQHVLSTAAGASVALSATTTDGLGLTGRGEGVASIATALVRHAGSLDA